MAIPKRKAEKTALGLLVLSSAVSVPLLKAVDLKQPVEVTAVERVNSAGITQALKRIYSAERVVSELRLK